MRKATRQQGGFTLIEMAIVLVIIGLIIGAVLKGQDLIQNARAKTFVNFVRAGEIAQWTHLDRKGVFNNDTNSDGLVDGTIVTWPGFQNAPEGNLTVGSSMYTMYFNSNATKNYIRVTGDFSEDGGLVFAESLDAAIDGTVDPVKGRVQGSDLTDAINGTLQLTTPVANFKDSKSIVYFFDRK